MAAAPGASTDASHDGTRGRVWVTAACTQGEHLSGPARTRCAARRRIAACLPSSARVIAIWRATTRRRSRRPRRGRRRGRAPAALCSGRHVRSSGGHGATHVRRPRTPRRAGRHDAASRQLRTGRVVVGRGGGPAASTAARLRIIPGCYGVIRRPADARDRRRRRPIRPSVPTASTPFERHDRPGRPPARRHRAPRRRRDPGPAALRRSLRPRVHCPAPEPVARSVDPQLLEAVVVDAEVVGQLVDHGDPDLVLEVERVGEVLLEREPEDRDRVRERDVVGAPRRPRRAVVEAVERLVGARGRSPGAARATARRR